MGMEEYFLLISRSSLRISSRIFANLSGSPCIAATDCDNPSTHTKLANRQCQVRFQEGNRFRKTPKSGRDTEMKKGIMIFA
jgi:hypothetical protein